jgi:hypothetical protein
LRYTLKQKIGVLVFDWPKFEKKLRGPSTALPHQKWVEICNRNESLERAPEGPGVLCLWKWTSDLHAPKVFPSLGLRLMKRAFQAWPIEMADSPEHSNQKADISFLIGHRGAERLPHLIATIKSIAAQRDISLECIVVEQSSSHEIESLLPSWVRYIHTPLPYPDIPYCRSWAFNVGARAAKGDVLVLHDNDMLVPQDYAAQIMRCHREGHEVMNLKRFIFYLSASHSERMRSSQRVLLDEAPETIVQNSEAGASVVVNRETYFEIGGFDEAFVGWGGEDNEFWERATTRKVWPYGYLPLVHLWHEPQAGKFDDTSTRKDLYWERSKEPVETRIRRLIGISPGNISGPVTAE